MPLDTSHQVLNHWYQIKCIHCPFMLMEPGQYINNSLSLNKKKNKQKLSCSAQNIICRTNKNKTNIWNYLV